MNRTETLEQLLSHDLGNEPIVPDPVIVFMPPEEPLPRPLHARSRGAGFVVTLLGVAATLGVVKLQRDRARARRRMWRHLAAAFGVAVPLVGVLALRGPPRAGAGAAVAHSNSSQKGSPLSASTESESSRG